MGKKAIILLSMFLFIGILALSNAETPLVSFNNVLSEIGINKYDESSGHLYYKVDADVDVSDGSIDNYNPITLYFMLMGEFPFIFEKSLEKEWISVQCCKNQTTNCCYTIYYSSCLQGTIDLSNFCTTLNNFYVVECNESYIWANILDLENIPFQLWKIGTPPKIQKG